MLVNMAQESRYRLAWMLCLLLLLGFIGNSVSNYLVSRNNVRKTITESSLPLTSDNIYSMIQRDLLKPIFISSMMSNDAFLRDWTINGEQDVGQIERYLSEIVKEYNTVTSFFISEKTRNYYYAKGLLKQVAEDEPRDAWYFRVRELDEPFEINVDPDLANQDAMTIFINYRVFDFDDNFIGAAGTGLTVNSVNQLIEEYEQRFGRQIFFCDRAGNIILSPSQSLLQTYAAIRDIPGLGSHATAILENESTTLVYSKYGDNYFLNSRFVPELDWYLIVEQTEDVLLAPLRGNLLLNILLALVITAFVAWLSISTIHRHQGKLQQRNLELSLMNAEIEEQRRRLQQSSDELAAANARLSVLNHEKDDFLGIVAHDLRNPLNGILGFCEEIRCQLPPEEKTLHEYLNEIGTAGYHMLDLIGDILNVSFIEGFHGDLALEPANWNHIAHGGWERFQHAAERKQISLELHPDPRADCEVLTRAKWIEICLNNLLSNAVKYAPQGSTVRIETGLADGCAELRVRDTGPGISEEDQTRMFQRFVRLSTKPTGNEHSTGLGLYIVRKICQRLGAEVKVESVLGKGTCFIIRQPPW